MRIVHKTLPRVALVAITVSTWPALCSAQSMTGSIRGRVLDGAEGAIVGAPILLTSASIAGAKDQSSVTDNRGSYLFALLAPGLYSLQTQVDGFEPSQVSEIRVEVGAVALIDVVLRPRGVTATVDVTASANVSATAAALTTRIDQGWLRKLPDINRHILQFSKLAPGIDAFAGAGQVIGQDGSNTVLANGHRSTQNSFYLDGAENTGAWRNWALQFPNPETVEEIHVQRTNASAELGKQPGAVINVITRSGTNQIRGAAFAFLHDERLNANAWINNRNGFAKGRDDQRRMGAVAGGPIRHDRSFFFGSYHRYRTSQPVTQTGGRFPTAAMKAGDFSEVPDFVRADGTRVPFEIKDPVTGQSLGKSIPGHLVNPAARQVIELLPTAAAYYDTAVRAFERPRAVDEYLAKVDHRMSGSQFLSATAMVTSGFSLDAAQGFTNNQAPAWGTANSASKQLTTAVRHRWGLANSWSIESHFALAGNTSDVVPLDTMKGQTAFGIKFPFNAKIQQPPTILLDNEGGFRADHQNNDFIGQRNYRFGATSALLKGPHALTFGGETNVDRVKFEVNRDLRTTYRFSGRDSLNGPILSASQVPLLPNNFGTQNFAYAFADLVMGRPVTASTAGYSRSSSSFRTSHAFLQDEWRATPSLTLWFGVRYEFASAASEAGDQFGGAFILNHQSSQYPNAPIGLAWDGDAGVPRGFVKRDRNNISPRVGAAWSVGRDERTVVRGSVGLYYASIPLAGQTFTGTSGFGGANARAANTILDDPFGASRVNPFDTVLQYGPQNPLPDAVGGYTPSTFPWTSQFQNQFVNGVLTPIFIGTIVGYDPEFTTPSSLQAHLTLERRLSRLWTFEASYVANRGRHQPMWQAFNAPVPAPGANTSDQSIRDRRPFATYGGGRLLSTILNSQYDALQMATNLHAGGLLLAAHYTLARNVSPFGIDAQDIGKGNVDGFSTGSASGEAILSSAGNAGQSSYPYDIRRDRAENGRRHTLVAHSAYEIPWDRPGSKAGQWLDGWTISGAFSAASGLPLNVLWGLDANADGSTFDRPTLMSPIRYSDVLVPSPGLDRRGAIQYLNRDAFIGPCNSNERSGPAAFCPTAGDLPRNAIRGVPVFNIDLALIKSVVVRGSRRLELRLEAVNVTNTNFLGTPELNLSSPFFGQVTGRIHRPRQMQVGIKFEF